MRRPFPRLLDQIEIVRQIAETELRHTALLQRNRGGNTVEEDESRYQVAIRRPDSTEAADWTGEVVGPPVLVPLKTVNVLTAGKTVIVFDKTNKKLWPATLAYGVMKGTDTFGEGAFGGENTWFGEGPCVERGNTLYIFDQAVLTAFDLATGNARRSTCGSTET